MGKLDHVKDTVVKKLAVSEPQTSIAKQVGVDQSTISRFAKEDKNIQLIEEEREKLVRVLPDAVENVKTLVEGMKDEDDIKKLELCYKASKDTLKATGLFPSPQYAHNIYNDNRTQTVIEPGIMKLFSSEFSQNMQVIDMNEENLNME